VSTVEFGWQIRPFEYIHLSVDSSQLDTVNDELLVKLAEMHASGSDTIGKAIRPTAPVANPQRTTVSNETPQSLIENELGGKVISESAPERPWDRPKPATAGSLFD